MGWEDTWKLPETPVDRAALEAAVELLCERHGMTVELVDEPRRVGVTLAFPVARVLEIVRELEPDEPVLGLPPARLAEEIEPPWDEAAPSYAVELTAADGDDEASATITIASDAADNRRIWAAAHTIFRALAEALCAEPAEDELMALWDSSAVLKPRDSS